MLRPDQDGHPRSKSGACRSPPTAHLPACPLPAAYVDGVHACALQVAGAHGSASSPARRHEHGRTSKLSRSSSTRPQASLRLEVCSRRTVCSRPPCVYAAARMPIRFRHELPALAQVQQVARGSAGAKNSRQNQEWPKNGVFRCACRAHTLALSTIRAHMAERGVLALCLQAPGETTAAVACAALASALSLPFSLPPPPSPHLRPHPRRPTRYPRGRPSSLWLLVTTSRARDWMQEHYARAARQRTLFRAQQSAAASPNTEKAKRPLDAFLCEHVAACDICMYAYKTLSYSCTSVF